LGKKKIFAPKPTNTVELRTEKSYTKSRAFAIGRLYSVYNLSVYIIIEC